MLAGVRRRRASGRAAPRARAIRSRGVVAPKDVIKVPIRTAGVTAATPGGGSGRRGCAGAGPGPPGACAPGGAGNRSWRRGWGRHRRNCRSGTPWRTGAGAIASRCCGQDRLGARGSSKRKPRDFRHNAPLKAWHGRIVIGQVQPHCGSGERWTGGSCSVGLACAHGLQSMLPLAAQLTVCLAKLRLEAEQVRPRKGERLRTMLSTVEQARVSLTARPGGRPDHGVSAARSSVAPLDASPPRWRLRGPHASWQSRAPTSIVRFLPPGGPARAAQSHVPDVPESDLRGGPVHPKHVGVLLRVAIVRHKVADERAPSRGHDGSSPLGVRLGVWRPRWQGASCPRARAFEARS